MAPAEAALLCACARRRADEQRVRDLLAAAPIDWDRFLRTAAAHGVTELLFEALQAPDLDVPRTVRDTLERKVIEATGENLKRTTELVSILRHLAGHGVRALAFKGPTLAAGVYGHLGRRVSNDLDIFVAPSDIDLVRPALRELGYVPPAAAADAKGALLYSWTRVVGRDDTLSPTQPWQTMVDIHVAFASWRFGIHADAPGVFARSVTVEVAGEQISTLHPHDLLMASVIHGLMHNWWPLRLVSDIDAVSASVEHWDVVEACAAERGMRRLLWSALALRQRLFGARVPPEVAAGVSADRAVQRVAVAVASRMFAASPGGVLWHRRPLLRAYLPDSTRHRAAFYIRDACFAVLKRYHSIARTV
ncbi:MAG: hypothetical protein AMXMBFR57_21240 [Acidimicrobiia bacterium]|jgi:hypothetical protein